MATSHVQPLFLLLISLFCLPTLLAIKFEYCNKKGYEFVNVSRVEISPNPVRPNDEELNINIFGYASKSFYEGGINVDGKSKNSTDLLAGYGLYEEGEACAFTAGTNFNLPVSGAPYYEDWGYYNYIVTVIEDEGSDYGIVRLCVDFDLPTSASTLVSA